MGFHDRGYASHRPAFGPEWTAVTALVIATVVVFIANMLGPAEPGSLNDLLALHGDLPRQPWRLWELVTYGFAHEAMNQRQQLPWHILGNMLTLWFFGRAVEDVTGRAEFLRFYLVALVVAGLAWLASMLLRPGGDAAQLVGASGAVTAVLAVFVWYFPHQTVLIWGVLPVPAWALGVLYVVWDLQGTTRATNVAHVAHLAGAAFGLLYAWRGWSLAGLGDLPGWIAAWRRRARAGRYRVVHPDEADGDDAALKQQVDRILEKISRSGSASLTRGERDTLERASRRLKDRSRMP